MIRGHVQAIGNIRNVLIFELGGDYKNAFIL